MIYKYKILITPYKITTWRSYRDPKTFWTGKRGVKSSLRHEPILQMEQCTVCKRRLKMRNKASSVTFVISGNIWSVFGQWTDQVKRCMKHWLKTEVRLFCMCALAVVSEVLCLSTFVNLKWNVNTHAECSWQAHMH